MPVDSRRIKGKKPIEPKVVATTNWFLDIAVFSPTDGRKAARLVPKYPTTMDSSWFIKNLIFATGWSTHDDNKRKLYESRIYWRSQSSERDSPVTGIQLLLAWTYTWNFFNMYAPTFCFRH